MMMMMMMMCFTGSKYSDTEELRKKNGRSILIYGSYLRRCILMCIMAKHHCVTLGICPALCYSEIKIYIYKYMKMRKKIWTLFKSLLQLCAQSYVQQTPPSSLDKLQTRAQRTHRESVHPLHIYVQFKKYYLLTTFRDYFAHHSREERRAFNPDVMKHTHTHPSVCVSKNVASFHSAMLYNNAPCGASVKVPVIFKRRHI